jgi:hypothetical protein
MVTMLHHLLQGFRFLHFATLNGKKKGVEFLGEESERNREFGGKQLIRGSGR